MSIWTGSQISALSVFYVSGEQATQELLDVNNKQVEHKGRIFYIINIHPCGALSSVSDLASPSVEAEV